MDNQDKTLSTAVDLSDAAIKIIATMVRGETARWRVIGYQMWVEGRAFYLIALEEARRCCDAIGDYPTAVDSGVIAAIGKSGCRKYKPPTATETRAQDIVLAVRRKGCLRREARGTGIAGLFIMPPPCPSPMLL